MKTMLQWFEEYGESHQNPTNKIIHYICVPLIMYSTLGLIDAVSQAPYLGLKYSLALPVLIFGVLFYLRLNWKLGLILGFISFAMVASFRFYPGTQFQLVTHALLFLTSWIAQFIGHKIEGKKPSFIQDLSFLLIGPLWVADKASLGALR